MTDLAQIAKDSKKARQSLILATKAKISHYTDQLSGWSRSLQYLRAEAQAPVPAIRRAKLEHELAVASKVAAGLSVRLDRLAALLALLAKAPLAALCTERTTDSCFGWHDATFVVFDDQGRPREVRYSFGAGDAGIEVAPWRFFVNADGSQAADVAWEDLSPAPGYPSRRVLRAAGITEIGL